MSNVYKFNSRREKLLVASEWLAKIDRELDAAERESLDHWLAADSENSKILLEVAGLWDKLDSLSRLADLFPKQDTLPGRIPVASGKRPAWQTLAWAASAVLAVGAALWLDVMDPNDSRPLPGDTVAVNESSFETGIGQISTVQLKDGSVLTLNTNSLVRTKFSPGSRVLLLDRGEVHVKVAHDNTRPFRVFVGNKYVEAVGTEFNLEITSDQRVELIVTEGKVRVGVHQAAALVATDAQSRESSLFDEETSGTTLVGAGEKAILGEPGEAVESLELEEIEVKLSWRGGNLVFRGEPLVDAINEIERYTEVEFVIQDESLKQVRVAGLFKAGDVDGLLATLKQNFNVDHKKVGPEQIILTNHAEIQ